MLLSNLVWSTRASGFLANGLPLPEVTVPHGGWSTFWSRFRFTPDATFHYADSNSLTGAMTPPDGSAVFDQVVLFDAHHDSGYRCASIEAYRRQGTYSCEDWMLEHQIRGTTDLEVRYPQWKPNGPTEPLPEGALTRLTLDDGQPFPQTFDALFVCRSGGWVPPWCDDDFEALIAAAPLDGVQVDDVALNRNFDVTQASSEVAAMQHVMQMARVAFEAREEDHHA